MDCSCNSQVPFEHCCGPFLSGDKTPETAQQLMRSRYSAYFHKKAAYLFETLHPDKRTTNTAKELESSIHDCNWINLRIIEAINGKSEDTKGIVEFIASYHTANGIGHLYERSSFLKRGDQWFYMEGEIKDPTIILIGRNQPCWCGSNKKFKKCHGR